tara:strand:- start:124544 stop:125446 length:903 start_codon:yes stop_codon:yes gene_type:complete
MDSRRLRHFLAVYDSGSLGQAAEEIHLTQPALSKSIHQLEDELDVQLFERTPMGVIPTVFGEALSLHARLIQSELRNAKAELQRLQGTNQGFVRVGMGPSSAPYMMPEVTRALHATHDGIRLSVIEGLGGQLIPSVRRGELDMAVGTWPAVNEKGLISETLTTDSMCLVVRSQHPLAGTVVNVGMLQDCAWMLPPHPQFWRERLDQHFFDAGLAAPDPLVVSNSSTYIKQMLLSEDLVSYLPRQLLKEEIRGGQIVVLEGDGIKHDIEVTLTYRERAVITPACREFINLLRETVNRDHAQ